MQTCMTRHRSRGYLLWSESLSISLIIVLCTLALSFQTSVFDVKDKTLLSNRLDGPENKLVLFEFHLRLCQGRSGFKVP